MVDALDGVLGEIIGRRRERLAAGAGDALAVDDASPQLHEEAALRRGQEWVDVIGIELGGEGVAEQRDDAPRRSEGESDEEGAHRRNDAVDREGSVTVRVEARAVDDAERELDEEEEDEEVDEQSRRREPHVRHVAHEEVVVARADASQLEDRVGERHRGAAGDVTAPSQRLDLLTRPRDENVALLVRRRLEKLRLARREQPEVDEAGHVLREVGHDALVEDRVDGVEEAIKLVDRVLGALVGRNDRRTDQHADVVQRRLHGVRVDEPLAPPQRHVGEQPEQQEDGEEGVVRHERVHLRSRLRDEQLQRADRLGVLGVRVDVGV